MTINQFFENSGYAYLKRFTKYDMMQFARMYHEYVKQEQEFIANQQDIDPEIVKAVNEIYWDLL